MSRFGFAASLLAVLCQVLLVAALTPVPLALAADIVFVVGAETPQFYPSMVGVVALIEMMIALIVSKGNSITLQRIAMIDKLRRKENAYFDLK